MGHQIDAQRLLRFLPHCFVKIGDYPVVHPGVVWRQPFFDYRKEMIHEHCKDCPPSSHLQGI